MSGRHVLVVGGGLAGIAAALHCADAGARVTLLEGREQLGGATWSLRHRSGLEVDNGQHVFMRCCTAYRGLLRRLGVEGRTRLAPLSVPVWAPDGVRVRLRRHPLPAPLHLAPSLLGFSHLPLAARLRAARTARALGALDPADPSLDAVRLGDWLAERGESAAAVDRLWDLFLRATLNVPAREAPLGLAAFVARTGLLAEPDAADLGVPEVPLRRLHGDPARAALAAAGVRVDLRAPVEAVLFERGELAVRSRGQRLAADALVLAVPHEAAARLLPAQAGLEPGRLRALGRSPIVNVHWVFDRRVLDEPFVAAVGSPLQWIFDRSAAAGLERGQYLVVSLSAADEWLARSRGDLERELLPALRALLPAARSARVEVSFTTREPAATFAARPGSGALRPGPRTAIPGLLLAGAWTDTGWPATMEGAVRSGLSAARLALGHPLRERRRSAPSLAPLRHAHANPFLAQETG